MFYLLDTLSLHLWSFYLSTVKAGDLLSLRSISSSSDSCVSLLRSRGRSSKAKYYINDQLVRTGHRIPGTYEYCEYCCCIQFWFGYLFVHRSHDERTSSWQNVQAGKVAEQPFPFCAACLLASLVWFETSSNLCNFCNLAPPYVIPGTLDTNHPTIPKGPDTRDTRFPLLCLDCCFYVYMQSGSRRVSACLSLGTAPVLVVLMYVLIANHCRCFQWHYSGGMILRSTSCQVYGTIWCLLCSLRLYYRTWYAGWVRMIAAFISLFESQRWRCAIPPTLFH